MQYNCINVSNHIQNTQIERVKGLQYKNVELKGKKYTLDRD